ncbi:DUF397 domain-containing protein [Streptomyces sp. RLB1-33]|nr:DUF397 domain-containing protein [Streptomyces sp. RLB1-33]QIY76975.1 DUF397 domain-containing protein [Streptomyces sp. RLB1-33]
MGRLAVQDCRAWFKSSYSNGAGGECVECAHAGGDTLIRDSKVDSGPTMSVRSPAWRSFVRALRQGSLDR